MLYPSFGVFDSEQTKNSQGYVTERDFFLVLQDENLDKESISKILEEISAKVHEKRFEKLEEFDSFISGLAREYNLPVGVSLATGLLIGKNFILKTINGSIFINRKNNFAKIIDGTNIAAGEIQEDDFYILATKEFVDTIEDKIVQITKHKDLKQAIEEIGRHEKTVNGLATLINIKSEEVPVEERPLEEALTKPAKPSIKIPKINFRNKKNLYILIAIIALSLLFLLMPKSESAANAKEDEISAELKQAQEVAGVNIQTATGLIAEAEQDFQELKKVSKNKSQIERIKKEIDESKTKILRSVDKNYSEFFDLSVDDKNAAGESLYLDGNNLLVLNPDGVIYKVSIAKKSIDKFSNSNIRDAKLLSSFEDNIYFLKSDGIYSIVDGKTKKAINKDKTWKEIVDMKNYAGNLYVLDAGANDIFKYTAGEKEFSDIGSYLRPDPQTNLRNSIGFAIDGAVYVSNENNVVKFINGFRDSFSFYVPDEVTISKIFTSDEVDNLYLLDKKQGKIYVLDKNGKYLKQVKSPILNEAQDFAILRNNAYILSSPKIYEIDL